MKRLWSVRPQSVFGAWLPLGGLRVQLAVTHHLNDCLQPDQALADKYSSSFREWFESAPTHSLPFYVNRCDHCSGPERV